MPRPRPAAIFLLPLLPLLASAQAPLSNWEVVKTLAPGTEIRVAAGTPNSGILKAQGTLDSVTDSDLLFTQKGSQFQFPRLRVISVSVKKDGHRVRNSVIGLAVGTLGGLAIGVAVGHSHASSCSRSGELLCGLAGIPDEIVGAVAGLAGGTILGAFWPTGGWRPIYAP